MYASRITHSILKFNKFYVQNKVSSSRKSDVLIHVTWAIVYISSPSKIWTFMEIFIHTFLRRSGGSFFATLIRFAIAGIFIHCSQFLNEFIIFLINSDPVCRRSVIVVVPHWLTALTFLPTSVYVSLRWHGDACDSNYNGFSVWHKHDRE